MKTLLKPFATLTTSTSRIPLSWICALSLLGFPGISHSSTTLSFEDFAPLGGLVNINPAAPYMEAGFTLTPTDSASAVFDSSAASQMLGNNSDWFGFAESNVPTLTLSVGSGAFDLDSLLIGPSTIASGVPITMTITGHYFGGGSTSAVFSGLTSATTATLGWANLTSVDFSTSDDAGLDDIVVTVPEPSSLLMLGVGMAMFAGRRREGGGSEV